MNSLTLGFFYVCGLAWALAECCMVAATGNWLPLLLYVLAFCVVFAILGCLDLSEKTINLTGLVMAGVLGLVLLTFSCASWKATQSAIIGLPKVLLAAAFLVGSFSLILAAPNSKESEEAVEH